MGTVSIGDFSRMTHLSIKTLRHYHDVGLLKPAQVDSSSGYRYYARSQVPVAQVIRRFRDIGMPVEEVRALLAAPTPVARNEVIRAHLDRLQSQLAETQASLRTLRALIDRPSTSLKVEYRTFEETQALAIAEHVSLSEFAAWWLDAFTEIHAALRSLGAQASGTPGALFATELFSEEHGDVLVFVPVEKRLEGAGRANPRIIPSAELAIVSHRGAHDDIDRAYGDLGTHVAEHELGVEGPVREYYRVDRFATPDKSRWHTEIGWPIFQASTAPEQSEGRRKGK
ncbi:MAG TPA: MerR family transcriptional regulator [Polyangiaceae bacterium]|nr:MerR family transcriptional regulator [Polyangiaceae bacterium]